MEAKSNPYVGPPPFRREEKGQFFGRSREMSNLASIITANSEVLLYAQSGVGKSSIINAGLVPELLERGFRVLQMEGWRGINPQDEELETVPNIFVYNCLRSWAGDNPDVDDLAYMTICSFLEKEPQRTPQESPTPLVLIFDQFEEYLIRHSERRSQREEFFKQVAEALEADPLLRVLFVIKEEFLAALDPYVQFFPDMLRTHYRLDRLRKKAACEAVEEPLKKTDRSYAKGVAELLVQKLLAPEGADNSGQEEEDVRDVDSTILQTVCMRLWESLKDDEKVITEERIKDLDVDQVLINFYTDALQAAIEKSGVEEVELRKWFNKELITSSGTRGKVFRGPKDTEGISDSAIEVLDKKRIIRPDSQVSGPSGSWYELTHDRLIEPIKKSNTDWLHEWDVKVAEENLKLEFQEKEARREEDRRKVRHRVYYGLVGVLFLVFVGYLYHNHNEKLKIQAENEKKQALDYDRVEGAIERLRQLKPYTKQKEVGESEADKIARYLWDKEDRPSLERLVLRLQELSDVIPRKPQAEPGAETDQSSPFILYYNSKSSRDEALTQQQWEGMAAALYYYRGIPAPKRLRLVQDPNMPVNQVRFKVAISPPGKSEEVEKIPGRKNKTLDQDQLILPVPPFRPDHLVITEGKLDKRLLDFMKHGHDDWPRVESKFMYGGPWRLVPHWTSPLFKAAKCEIYPQEKMGAIVLANILIDNPEYILTHAAVLSLLEGLKRYSPQTVEEALASRGGVDGIKQDLVKEVRKTNSIKGLRYLLDSWADQKEPAQQASKLDKSDLKPYAWLPPLVEPEIRVYLGPRLLERFTTPEGEWKPEPLQELDKLKGDFYRRFGLNLPDAKSFEDKQVADNALRIELLDQTEESKGVKPISFPLDSAHSEVKLIEELRPRCEELRTWWLSPEKVHQLMEKLPAGLSKWLRARYSLTDLKIILRELINPPESDKSAREGDTVRYPSWLLGSLTFWLPGDPRDAKDTDPEQVAEYLRQTQLARLSPPPEILPEGDVALVKRGIKDLNEGEVADLVKRGIEDLNKGNCESASRTFQKAIKIDPAAATSTFLALYARQPEVTLEGRLSRIEEDRPLPRPGELAKAKAVEGNTRYDIEEILEQSGPQLSPERERFLKLCLIQSYFGLNYKQRAQELCDQLLSKHGTEEWGPDEEYFLAYYLLNAHKKGLIPDRYFDPAQGLLVNSFKRWDDEQQAVKAFGELSTNFTGGRPPSRYLDMMDHIADLRPSSYWIPLIQGDQICGIYGGPSLKEAQRALVMFDRAEGNLGKVEPEKRSKERAWLDLSRVKALRYLLRYHDQTLREQDVKSTLKLLENLIKSVPPGQKGWPPLDSIYNQVVGIYLDVNNIEEAANWLARGRERFPESEEFYGNEFFLKLARLDLSPEYVKSISTGSQMLFYAALAQLLAGEGDVEYNARRFCNSNQMYRDLIRMMLYCNLLIQGKDADAQDLLKERWQAIDQGTWKDRLQEGDPDVWREMLIGYYYGAVPPEEIFSPLKNPEAFTGSQLGKTRMSFPLICSEAYFYDAILQGARGDKATRNERKLNQLKKVIDIQCYASFEYHMARYLVKQMQGEKAAVPVRNP